MNEYLPDEIVVIHKALSEASVPHAFGGAIALAYWGTPRYTHDVDINIELPAEQYAPVLDALANVFPLVNREKAESEIRAIAQTRLRWDTIPILTAEDLIICKSLFNRPKDWFDIENIVTVQSDLDQEYLHRWLREFPDPENERLPRLDRLLHERQGGGPE